MFEEVILLGAPDRSIALETRRGRPIRNVQTPEPGKRERARYELIRKKYGSAWSHRKPACGFYNCFGMVFASRRTSILEEEMVERVLTDDGYRLLVGEEPVPGDLVLYRDGLTGGLLHAAMVLRCERMGNASIPFALSKWNDSAGEDMHHVQHHCWRDFDLKLEYWTDRPQP